MRLAVQRPVPIFVPTPCIEALRVVASAHSRKSQNSLITRNNSQCLATAVPTAKSLKIRKFMVRDQEAGGSNPLAPTKYLSCFQKHMADSGKLGVSGPNQQFHFYRPRQALILLPGQCSFSGFAAVTQIYTEFLR
jgi:hypothetical protein